MTEKKKYVFPDGFLWGTATSSFQVEGGIENCDWAQAARDGRVPPAGLACDHYNRYEEDFDIAQSLNMSSQRFSIEWSRVEPEEGVFDEKELEHYKKVVHAIRARGMEPFVTLWHFTLPLWFVKKGGFRSKKGPEIFARYAGKVAEYLKDDVVYYTTMNEPMVWIGNGHVSGIWPPFEKNFFNFITLPHKLIDAHKLAYREIKKHDPTAHVGATKNNIVFQDTALTWLFNIDTLLEWGWDRRFHNAIRNHQDFIGINHYFRVVLGTGKTKTKECPRSDFGWELNPETLYLALMELKKYKIPIFITEHGLADAKDTYRKWFIEESLHAVHRAIANGIDIRGYGHWSLLDNYEWAEGFKMKFGLVEVRYDENRKRVVRESAQTYARIAGTNTLEL